MFLEVKNWSTRVTLHEEEYREVLGPLRDDQDQVGDVGDSLGIYPHVFEDRTLTNLTGGAIKLVSEARMG